MPVILTFGLKPEALLDSESRIDAFLEVPRQEHGQTLVEAVRSGIDGGGAVVAIVPTWFDEDGAMRLEMVRAALDTGRLAIHRSGLPPLAGAALASLASAVAPFVPSAGVLASILGQLESELHVITWLGSVAGLKTPSPTMAQHMASLTPGRAFGVSSWPEPVIHKLRGGATPTVPIPELTRPSQLVVAPRSGGDLGWVTGPVNAALGGLPIRQVEATPAGADWWGTGKLVEAVVHPVDVEQLAADLSATVEAWVCRWCRELVATTPCPLCGHRGRPARRSAAEG